MARSVKSNVGVIGLGLIGSRVVANLRRAGYQVWVWNRSPRPEPNFLSSPVEVAESAKIIQIFVSDGPALIETVKAMSPVLGPDHIILNHATVSPKETAEAARLVQEKQAQFLDAPFTGSRDQAEAGQIVFLIGGDELTLAKVRPQLEINAKAVIRIGEIGQATAIKIVTNLMAAIAVGSFAEALALLHKQNVPLPKLIEVLQYHGVRSPLGDMKIPGMITGDFDPRFALKHMFKDIQIALSIAEESGLDLPEASAFAGHAMSGIQKGWADLDFSVLAKQYGYSGERLPEGLPSAASDPARGEKDSTAERLFRSLTPFLPKK